MHTFMDAVILFYGDIIRKEDEEWFDKKLLDSINYNRKELYLNFFIEW